jgi:hypothetical protein
VAQAVEGDLAAARLLLSYTLGKPAAAVDPDTLDQQEWQLYRQRPVNGQDLLAVLSNLPVDLALTILRAALPGVSRGMAGLAAQIIGRDEPAEPKPAPRPRRARTRRTGVPETATEEPADAAAGVQPAAEPMSPPADGPGAAGERPPVEPPADLGAANSPGNHPAAASEPSSAAAGASDDCHPGEQAKGEAVATPAEAAPVPTRPGGEGAAGAALQALREADARLRDKLQALLAGLPAAGPGRPADRPTANGANGAAPPRPPGAGGST